MTLIVRFQVFFTCTQMALSIGTVVPEYSVCSELNQTAAIEQYVQFDTLPISSVQV